jgi:hypothetical protein
VNVIYGSAAGLQTTGSPLPQLFSQDTPNVPGVASNGVDFGDRVATGDFNGDGKADLVASVPFADVGAASAAGSMVVIYGSTSGLQTSAAPFPQLFSQDTTNVPGVAGGGDEFALAVAVGDFNADGKADVAAGVPGDNINGNSEAGSVNVVYGSASGLQTTAAPLPQLFSQDTVNVPGVSAACDFFGAVGPTTTLQAC